MICEEFEYSNHCLLRALERDIDIETIELIIQRGEIIKEYPNDKPYSSYLILGFDKNRPVHIVVAFNQGTCIVITVYEPDTLVWTNDFKTKK